MIYPLDVGDALAAGPFTPQQFDWVFLDSAVELPPEDGRRVEALGRCAVVLVDSDDERPEGPPAYHYSLRD